MRKNNKRVLMIAPHMDDEVLGCGGTIARHVADGDRVFVCFVAHRIYDHKFDERANQKEVNCTLKAKDILGYEDAFFLNLNDERLDVCIQDILIPLEKCVNKINPDIVYLNHKGDNHQDHQAVFRASMVALRSYAVPNLKQVVCYETPSSTEQAPQIIDQIFIPNYYVDITSFLDVKLSAMECYTTENREFPHPRSNKAIKVLANKRGVETGMSAAEAFMIIRSKWV